MHTISEKTILIPRFSNVKEFILATEKVFTVDLPFADQTIQIKTNTQNFAEKCREHFHANVLEKDSMPEAAVSELSFFQIPSAKYFSDTLERLQFIRVPHDRKKNWVRDTGDNLIICRPPDFILYQEKVSGETYVLFGGMEFLQGKHKNGAANLIKSKGYNSCPYFEMICDHLYILIAQKNNSVCFHGAFVDIGNKTVLLAGQSGQGKSTTALSLVREGATLLSDEIVLFSTSSDDTVWAEGIPIAPRITSDTVIAVSDLEKTLNIETSTKHSVDLAGCAGTLRACKKLKVDCILFLKSPESLRSMEHSITPLDEMEAFKRLNQQLLGYNIPQLNEQRITTMLGLAANSTAYTFTPGTSLTTLLPFLRKTL